LQEVLMQHMRYVVQTHLHDIKSFRATGGWQPLNEEIDEGVRKARARLTILAERIRDETVRQLIDQYTAACTEVTRARNEAESKNAIEHASNRVIEVQQQVGSALRRLDDDEDLMLNSNR